MEIFSSLTERDLKVHVELGDDAKYAVKGEGTITFQLESGGSFDAHDVLYIPGLKKNFLSVLAMEDRGFFCYFSEREGTHTSRESYSPNNTVVIGVREGTLYRLHGKHVQDLVHDSDNLCELWHRRLGHLHYREFSNSEGDCYRSSRV
jgi:hypothetical protein